MEYHIKSVELSHQVRLPYVEQGDPTGVPLLLLHGYIDSWRSFELLLPFMPDSIHTFALTQRGHGDASRPRQGYRPRDFVEDVAQFGYEKTTIIDVWNELEKRHSGGKTRRRFFNAFYLTNPRIFSILKRFL